MTCYQSATAPSYLCENEEQCLVLLQKQKFLLCGFIIIFFWDGNNYPDLQDPTNKNIVKCDEKLKTVLLGRSTVELSELPMIVKLHFPKFPR